MGNCCASTKTKPLRCSECKKPGLFDPPRGSGKKRLQKCPRCGETQYCGLTCQKKHWPIHKVDCAKRKKTSSSANAVQTTKATESKTKSAAAKTETTLEVKDDLALSSTGGERRNSASQTKKKKLRLSFVDDGNEQAKESDKSQDTKSTQNQVGSSSSAKHTQTRKSSVTVDALPLVPPSPRNVRSETECLATSSSTKLPEQQEQKIKSTEREVKAIESALGVDRTRKLEDHYEIMDDAVLGSGVSSIVKVCTDKDGIEFAVKIISKKRSGIDEEKFAEEIRLLQKLRHPNIMTMEDVFEDEDNIYIVTELMCGGELFDRILEKKVFSERDAAMYTQKILEAVAYLHSHGVAHRDLKPDNVLFTELGDEGELKIVDFGFALDLMSSKRKMQAQAQLGTQGYAAPEIFSQSAYDEKCDVWSIGVITYIMLSGLPPFIEYDEHMSSPFWVYVNQMKKNPEMELQFPRHLFKNVTGQAQNFIRQCLEKNPMRRARSTDLLNHNWFRVARTDVLDRGPRKKYMSMTLVSSKKTPFNFEEAKKLYMKNDEEGLNKLIEQTAMSPGSMTLKFPRYSALPGFGRKSIGMKRSVTENHMTEPVVEEGEEESQPTLVRKSSHGTLDLTPTKQQ